MIQILLYALLIWFLYNLVFRFIIPIYRTTREVKRKFRDMHQQMQDQARRQQGYTQPSPEPAQDKKPEGDYIDFEEIN